MEQPVYYWDPVIAPSGMVFYTGFVRGLVEQYPGRLADSGTLGEAQNEGGQSRPRRTLLGDLRERIRDVRQASDGSLYLLTDSGNGQISYG